MKQLIFPLFLFVLLASCSQTVVQKDKISERIGSHTNTSNLYSENTELMKLLEELNHFSAAPELFQLKPFETAWEQMAQANTVRMFKANDLEIWTELTGFLLELTQEEKYAAELERIGQKGKEMVHPFVLTKNVDHIFVNLFDSTQINYDHTLGGQVSVRQESDYPSSGSIRLHFGMSIKRYIELYIRIPQWAEGATVTVKQVKYFAEPGSYCKIAKKWKEGDLVEIELPVENFQIPNSGRQISSSIQ